MPPAVHTVSGGLREILSRASDDPHGADRLHIFSLALPEDVDPLSLWAVRPDGWAGSWETDDERWAGVGRTLALAAAGAGGSGGSGAAGAAGADQGLPQRGAIEAVEDAVWIGDTGADARADAPGRGSEVSTVRLFGALPFQPDEDARDWGFLPKHGFVLPRWSVFRGAGFCHLQLALADRPDPEQHADLLEELAGVEAALLSDGAADEASPPGSISPASISPGPARSEGPDGRDAWNEAIQSALREIRRGEFEKVVLSRCLDLRLGGPVSAEFLLRRLRTEGTGRFRFGLRHDERAFVGASPECLFEKRGSRVAVEALAGTFDLGVDPDAEALVRAAEHLFASGKDLEEHALVVRGIVDALRPLAASVEAESWPDVRAAGSLAHLSTAIAADLRDGVSAFDLIAALHPTPAVGGLPREAALRFIRRHEPESRGLYAAPIGWLEPGGDACLAVGIRSALLWPDRARVFAGAGIVAASDPEAEWEETGAKLRWLGELLGGSA